jgi:hypothetical protein
MEAALEHEKRDRILEVAGLQAQLHQRGVELQIARSSLEREKDGRCAAEGQLAGFESKTTEQEQQIKELEDEAEGLYDDVLVEKGWLCWSNSSSSSLIALTISRTRLAMTCCSIPRTYAFTCSGRRRSLRNRRERLLPTPRMPDDLRSQRDRPR